MIVDILPHPEISFREVTGVDQHKIVVVDGLLRDVDEVRAWALSARYSKPAEVLYPGLVCHPPWDFGPLRLFLEQVIGCRFRASEATFRLSMLTLDGEHLVPQQRRPHADGCMAAGVIYLNSPEQCSGGTAFYRHATTGFEWLPQPDNARHEAHAAAIGLSLPQIESMLTTVSPHSSGYMRDSDADWQLLELVEMRTNRLVLYEGDLFHSAYVDDRAFGTTPDTRRLTLNIFLDPLGAP